MLLLALCVVVAAGIVAAHGAAPHAHSKGQQPTRHMHKATLKVLSSSDPPAQPPASMQQADIQHAGSGPGHYCSCAHPEPLPLMPWLWAEAEAELEYEPEEAEEASGSTASRR